MRSTASRERATRGGQRPYLARWWSVIGGAVILALAAAGWCQQRRQPSISPNTQFVPPSGLTEAEATARYDANRPPASQPPLVRTWDQVRRESVFSVFNLNVIGLSVVQMLLGEWLGASLTLALLVVTAALRVLQEVLSARRLAAFVGTVRPRYTVLRGGRARSIDPDRVVQGDVLVIGPGDQLLADGSLSGPSSIWVDASPVTGEQGWRRVKPGGPLFGGSFCVGGRGLYVAERLGSDRLVSSHLAVKPQLASRPTPLERLVARILQLLFLVVVFWVVLLVAAYFRIEVGDAQVLVEIAPVIFSLLPSGLYLMIIISYVTGTAQLARRGALVRSARSVESLAETTVLCFTEIGLLSGTSMELTTVPDPDGKHPSEGRVRQLLGDAARSTTTTSLITSALADSFEGERRVILEETSNLITLGWTGIIFKDSDLEGVYVIGERRALEVNLTAPLPAGHSTDPGTLVVAYRPDRVPLHDAAGEARLPRQLVALGTVQFRRQLRPEAMEVVRGFVQAGVRIKAFSASSPERSLSMLREAGLASADLDFVQSRGMLSRSELDRLPRTEWARVAREHALFGGLTPVQVGQMVRALRDAGEIVTVVGDGVTDLAALQGASLAVAQPASTQATLELADVVLLDNSPAALLSVLHRAGHRAEPPGSDPAEPHDGGVLSPADPGSADYADRIPVCRAARVRHQHLHSDDPVTVADGAACRRPGVADELFQDHRALRHTGGGVPEHRGLHRLHVLRAVHGDLLCATGGHLHTRLRRDCGRVPHATRPAHGTAGSDHSDRRHPAPPFDSAGESTVPPHLAGAAPRLRHHLAGGGGVAGGGLGDLEVLPSGTTPVDGRFPACALTSTDAGWRCRPRDYATTRDTAIQIITTAMPASNTRQAPTEVSHRPAKRAP